MFFKFQYNFKDSNAYFTSPNSFLFRGYVKYTIVKDKI